MEKKSASLPKNSFGNKNYEVHEEKLWRWRKKLPKMHSVVFVQ